MVLNSPKVRQITHFFQTFKARKIIVLIVYVDDIVVTGDDGIEISCLKGDLAKKFEIKDLGRLRYFLVIEVARSKKSVLLSQMEYVID